MEDGSVRAKQKLYQNVVNEPLITGDADKKVLEILCVPELHLLLGRIIIYKIIFNSNMFIGIVDKLLTEFERGVFPTKEAGLDFMNNFLKKVAI